MQRVRTELTVLVPGLERGVEPSAAAEAISLVEEAGRLMDAARIFAAASLARNPHEAERLGFASPVAGVATLARVTERTARTRLRLAEGVCTERSISGAPLPPQYPQVASALSDGLIGVEAAALIARELDSVAHRVPAPVRAVTEALMVNLATGLDPAGERRVAPVSVDFLSGEIRQISATIDPDGARPREERAAQNRDFWVGKQNDDGLLPIGGLLLSEVGGLLLRLNEARRRSPRFLDAVDGEVDTHDSRTPGQRRHDDFVEILMAAAGAEGAPQLNGRAVSVLVTVPAEDLYRAAGLDSDPIGIMSGSQFPVSRGQVERFIDAGGYREVTLAPSGAVIGIGSTERCFTSQQGLAIAARDGERCFTPGCTTSHTALQIHHVVSWRDGGPTNTSNGILLCYWHHRRVDDGPWQYRMVNGLPEVRGPGIREWTPAPSRLTHAA